MSYIGQGLPADVFSGFTTDSFTGDGSATTFTLSKAPFSEDGLIVVINNVIQKPTTNFTVSGTTLTIVGTAVASSDVIYAIHTSGALPIGEANALDLQGQSDKLILDADGDSTISADTDDQIDFKAGGVDEMTLSSTGLVINEGSNDRDIRIETNANTHGLFVDGGNNAILINKSSPTQNYYHLDGTIIAGFEMFGTANAAGRMSAFTYGSADTGGHLMTFGKSRSATPDNYTIVQDGDQLGRISFQGTDGTHFVAAAQIHAHVDGTPGANDMPGRLSFHTTADGGTTLSERMRIDSSGNVGIGTTSLTSTFHVEKSVHNTAIAVMNNSTGSTPYGIFLTFGGASPDSHTPYFLNCSDSTTNRCIIKSDGDLLNHDNSYGQISDERIKQNITNANSQWDDIKSIKVRNFERKDDIAEYGEGKKVQIGVVAQEVETVSPGLIKEGEPMAEDIKMSSEFGTLYTSDDAETQDAVLYTSSDQAVIDGDKDVGDVKTKSTKQVGDIKSLTGEKVKTVSYSVLYMKAIKALQEAMTKIETLETKVKALEDA